MSALGIARSEVVEALDAEESREDRLGSDLLRLREGIEAARMSAEIESMADRCDGIGARLRSAALRENRDEIRQLQDEARFWKDQAEKFQRLLREAEERADMDPLTRLSNRAGFEKALGSEWRRGLRSKQPVGLVFVDVDDFKSINDLYGHQAGDQALAEIARAIGEQAKRSGEIAGRWGGDEFVVVIPGVDIAGALALAERVRASVGELRLQVDGKEKALSVSAGAAALVPDIRTREDQLVKLADRAVYQAKERGRGRSIGLDVDADGREVVYAPDSGPEPVETKQTSARRR